MSKTPREIFTSLKAGDLLEIPCTRHDNQSTFTMLSAVLRVGPEGELYLSHPAEHRATPKAYTGYNPFRWDPKKGVLVDKNGELPRWYTIDIRLERAAATDLAHTYSTVPRLEQLRPEHMVDDEKAGRFIRHDPRHDMLEGIVTNGEAGSPACQLALALDVMGIAVDSAQMPGLGYFMERFAASNRVGAVIIALGDRNAAEAALAAKDTAPLKH